MSTDPTASSENPRTPERVDVASGTIVYRWLGGTWVCDDLGLQLKSFVIGPEVELLDEIRRLRAENDDLRERHDALVADWWES